MAGADAAAPASPLALLAAWTRPHRLLLCLAIAASAIGAVLSLVPMLVLYALAGRIVDGNRDVEPLLWLALVGLGAVILHLVLGAVANQVGHRLAFAVQRDLRLAMIDRISRMPAGALEGRAGALKKVVLDDTGQMEGLLAHVVPDMAAGLAAFLAGAIILAALDWRLLLAALALLPLAAIAQRWTYGGSAGYFARWSEAEAEANRAILAFVRGIATLKAFNRLASTLGSVSGAVHSLRDVSNAITRRSRYPYALFNAALATNLIVVLPVGAHLVSTGTIGLPGFVLAAALGARLTAPLGKVVFAATVLSRTSGALGRIGDQLDAPVLAEGGSSAAPAGHDLRLDGVSFTYPDGSTALSAIDLVVPEGKVTAIVGPSGAGKSTLVRLLLRLDEISAGRITLGGVDIRDLPLADFHARFGVVFQKPILFPGSVRDNVVLARPAADSAAVERAAIAARIDALLVRDGAGRIGEVGTRLSGGEKQRIAIARMVLKDAPIIILDEATASVDPFGEAAIQDAVAAAGAGKTLVVVAHRLASVRDADQIVVLREGRIEACGGHDRLLVTSPTYASLWATQEGMERDRAASAAMLRSPA